MLLEESLIRVTKTIDSIKHLVHTNKHKMANPSIASTGVVALYSFSLFSANIYGSTLHSDAF